MKLSVEETAKSVARIVTNEQVFLYNYANNDKQVISRRNKVINEMKFYSISEGIYDKVRRLVDEYLQSKGIKCENPFDLECIEKVEDQKVIKHQVINLRGKMYTVSFSNDSFEYHAPYDKGEIAKGELLLIKQGEKMKVIEETKNGFGITVETPQGYELKIASTEGWKETGELTWSSDATL